MRIDDIVIDPENLKIWIGEKPQDIQAKALKVFIYLAQRSHQLVSREALINEFWNGNQVTGDKALSNSVWKLRKLFESTIGMDADIIKTVAGEGYQIIPEVEFLSPSEGHTEHPPTNRLFIAITSIVSVSCLLLIATLVVFNLQKEKSTVSPNISLSQPLVANSVTTASGIELYPAVSPDNQFITFVWQQPSGLSSLILKSLVSGQQSIIAESHKKIQRPSWSPDGNRILYALQTDPGQCLLFIVDVDSGQKQNYQSCIHNFSSGHAWANTSNQIAYNKPRIRGKDGGIYLGNTDTDEEKLLSPIPEKAFAPVDFKWSPNDQYIAFTQVINMQTNALSIINLEGEIQELIREPAPIRGHTWLADESAIIYSTIYNDRAQLKQIDLLTKKVTPLPLETEAYYPEYAKTLNQLFFEKRSAEIHIARLSLEENNKSQAATFIESLGNNFDADFHSDSNRVIYSSTRTGESNIWIQDFASNKATNTGLKGKYATWSPDGQSFAFVASGEETGTDQVFQYDLTSKLITKITNRDAPHLNPTWSPNGRFIYYVAPANDQWNIWRHSISDGRAKQITQNGGIYVGFHPNGQQLIYTIYGKRGIYTSDLDGHRETRLVTTEFENIQGNWTVSKSGIYYLDRTRDADKIIYFDFNNQLASVIAELAPKQIANSNFSFMPQSNALMFSHYSKQQGDIMRVDLSQ